MSKEPLSKEQLELIVKELKSRDTKPFQIRQYCFKKQLDFIEDKSRFKVAVCSRRCLAEDTLVLTTLGPKKIQDITINDYVYSEYGTPVRVKQVFFNGEQEVVAAFHGGRVLFEATSNHVMLTKHRRSAKFVERKLEDFYAGIGIVRTEVMRYRGKHYPYAYSIGALLGDGCSRQGNLSYLCISSENSDIPHKVAKELGAVEVKKQKGGNYTYNIYGGIKPDEYNKWCMGRYAHEKICHVDTVLSWDRDSRLAFFAGLLDTDGSVSNLKDGISIRIGMQSKNIIDALEILFYDLWQCKPQRSIDNRSKYKNGPIYNVGIKHNYFGKKILKDLTPFLVSGRKKYKPEYEDKLENNYNSKFVGVKISKSTRKVKTYDIHVDSDTNLYLLASGLVTHNSGKSEACAAHLVHMAYNTPRSTSLYITLTRTNAKRLVWDTVSKIIKNYKIDAKANISELLWEFKNGSKIYFSGANTIDEIEKFRGFSFNLVYLDEAQSFRPYIRELVDDVLAYAVLDTAGSICMIGTPGPIPAGYFFDASRPGNPGWKAHHWTIHDNPFIQQKAKKTAEELLTEERIRRGVSATDPSYLREALGQWTTDLDSLVFKYNISINHFSHLPTDELVYIFGIDLGYNDSDAIAVLGYSKTEKKVYLVEEYIKNKQTITDLIVQIERLRGKYKPVKMKIDAGALGKKISEELRRRYNIPVEAAEKSRKLEYIELMNDDLRTGRLMISKDSVCASDFKLIQWDVLQKDKRTISDGFHSDIADAVLYAWRECNHFFNNEVKPKVLTDEDKVDAFWDKESKVLELKKKYGISYELEDNPYKRKQWFDD